MEKFAAIDFETANWQQTSVCSVGIVVMNRGVIEDRFYSLIHPAPNFYSRFESGGYRGSSGFSYGMAGNCSDD